MKSVAEFIAANKQLVAQFWQAYCDTEGKAISEWSNQEKVANINKDNHLRNHPNHDVSINSK